MCSVSFAESYETRISERSNPETGMNGWRLGGMIGCWMFGVFDELKTTTPGCSVAGKSVATFPVKLMLSKRR